jgi:hypothetical protein
MTTLQLSGAAIDGDQSSCTVHQFLLILEELAADARVADLVWYGADISPSPAELEQLGTQSASKIGTLEDLRGLFRSLTIPQLDFGILIAVATEERAPPSNVLLSSDGEAGRRFETSEIELLAFDDTYIEITSDRPELVERLIARFPTAKAIDGTTP